MKDELADRLMRLTALVENDECHWNMDGPSECDCVDVLVSDLSAVLQALRSQPSVEAIRMVLFQCLSLDIMGEEYRIVGEEEAARQINSMYEGKGNE